MPVPSRLAAQCAFAAGALLTVLCSIVLFTGVSQQTFERLQTPHEYAMALVDSASTLRWIVAIDDLFIVAYVASTTMLFAILAKRGAALVGALVLGGTVVAGVLDFMENHHILTMLRGAELGLLPSSSEIELQVVVSSLKWLLGHAAFAMLGLVLELPGRLGHLVRTSLIGFQLPLGAAALCVVEPNLLSVLTWARYLAFLSGFFSIGWLMRGLSARSRSSSASYAVADGSSARV